MISRKLLQVIAPKSKGGVGLLAAFVFLFCAYFLPPLSGPKRILLAVGVAVGAALLLLVPGHAIDRWNVLHYRLRGAICSVLVYSVVVTIGSFGELYSFSLWLEFLTLRAPFSSTHFVALVGAAFAYSTQKYRIKQVPPDFEEIFDGPRLMNLEEAKAELAAELPHKKGEPTFNWGGIERPISSGDQRFVVVGAPEAGKTKLIQLAMKGVLPNVVRGSNRRALVYDVKRDVVTTIVQMGVPIDRIQILNAFDTRRRKWALAKDVTERKVAEEIGSLLVPDKGDVQPFFPDAARHLIGGVMDVFLQRAPGKWELRDVVLTLQSDDRLRIVLSETPATAYLVEKYVNGTETYQSISSTVENVMRRLSFVAEAWEDCDKEFSVTEWFRSESIIVLGAFPKLESTLQQLNAALIHRISQELLSGAEANTLPVPSQTWLFIDELRQAGKIPKLADIMIGGRTKGACVMTGFQDFPGLAEVYGENFAKEIFGGHGNKAFLKIEEQSTQELASKHFDEQTLVFTHYNPAWSESESHSFPDGRTQTGKSDSMGASRHFRKVPVVPPHKFLNMKLPSRHRGLSGYFIDHSLTNPYFATVPGEVIDSIKVTDTVVDNFIPLPEKPGGLTPWNAKDLERLGLSKHADVLLKEPKNSGTKLDQKQSLFTKIKR